DRPAAVLCGVVTGCVLAGRLLAFGPAAYDQQGGHQESAQASGKSVVSLHQVVAWPLHPNCGQRTAVRFASCPILYIYPVSRAADPGPMQPSYAELHCISNFSFLRGASHPEELVERALALGYPGLAITDECSFAGAVRAHLGLQ